MVLERPQEAVSAVPAAIEGGLGKMTREDFSVTRDNDYETANKRVARANTIRKANRDGKCPCCGDATPYRRIAALWKAAFTMRDAEIGDMAWEAEQAVISATCENRASLGALDT